MVLDALITGIAGACIGSLVGYITSNRGKTAIYKEERNSFKHTIENYKRQIASLRGKMGSMRTLDLRDVEEGEDSMGQTLDAIMDKIPAPWRKVVRPLAEVGIEKFKNDPKFQEMAMAKLGELTKSNVSPTMGGSDPNAL